MILKKNFNGFVLAAGLITTLMISQPVAASDAGSPAKDLLSNAYTGKVYSPYAKGSRKNNFTFSHLRFSSSLADASFAKSSK